MEKIKRYLCCLLFCFCAYSNNIRAQQNVVDSLQKVLLTAKEDTTEVNTLNLLARQLCQQKPDTSIYYAKRALSISANLNFKIGIAESYLWWGTALLNLAQYDEAIKQMVKGKILLEQLLLVPKVDVKRTKRILGRIYNNLGLVCVGLGDYPEAMKSNSAAIKIRKEIEDNRGLADSYNNVGLIEADHGNYPEALKNYFAALKIRKELEDKGGIADSYNNIALIYGYRGNYTEAIRSHKASLELRKETENKKGISDSYNNLGLIYADQGNHTEALKNYFASLKMRIEIKDLNGEADSYNNIGLIYYSLGNPDLALRNHLAALKIRKEIKNKFREAGSYNNIGNIYFDKRNYSEAKKNYLASLDIIQQLGDKAGIAMIYTNLGNVHKDQGNYSEALEKYFSALRIREELESKYDIADLNKNIGSVYQILGDISKATLHGEKALVIAKELKSTVLIQNGSYALYEIYKKAGKFKESLRMHELAVQSHDSIINEKNQKEVMSQQFKYDYDKKALADSLNFASQKNISDLKNEAEHKAERIKRYTLYAGLGLVIIFSLFIFNRFRVAARQKKTIEYQNFQIVESINYSQKIQASLLPSVSAMQKSINNLFVFYEPKDIVSGDFYWYKEFEKYTVLACVDCTGHGVPGGFMSTLGSLLMDKIVSPELSSPSEMLSGLSTEVIQTLRQQDGGEIQDGMDLSICLIDRENKTIEFAGARNGIVIISNGQAKKYKADLYPVGGNYMKKGSPIDRQFKTQKIAIDKNDWIYMYTDGFMEQSGGDKGLPMNYEQFENHLIEISNNSNPEEKINLLRTKMDSWRGKHERTDDVLIMGFRVI